MASTLGGRGDRGLITGINVTPLVDVTLVLLVIFMVTAKIIVAPAVPLDLPKSGSGQDVQMVLSVMVPLDGPLFVNGEPVQVGDRTRLAAIARQAVSENPDARAVLHVDGHVEHQRVIELLDRLAAGGLTRVAFATATDWPPESGNDPPASPNLRPEGTESP